MRKLGSQGCISGVGQRSPMERNIIPSEILQEQEEGVITASQQTNQKCGWWCITSNSLSVQTTNMKNYRSLRGALAYCDSGVQKAEVRERTNPHSLLVSGLGDSVTGSVTMTASLLPPGKGKLQPTPWLYMFISPKSKHNVYWHEAGRKKQSTPLSLPGKFHGQRSLVGYSPWSHRESDTT